MIKEKHLKYLFCIGQDFYEISISNNAMVDNIKGSKLIVRFIISLLRKKMHLLYILKCETLRTHV